MSQELLFSSIRCIERKDNLIIGMCAHTPTHHLTYHADMPFPAASIIKLAIALSVYALSVNDRSTAMHRVRISSRDIYGGSGVLAKYIGTSYTVKQLIWYLLAHSDNTAQNALVRALPSLDIQSFISQHLFLHHTHYIPLSETTPSHYSVTTPADAAILMSVVSKLSNHDTIARAIHDALSYCAQTQRILDLTQSQQLILLKHGTLPVAQHYALSCHTNKHTYTIALLTYAPHATIHHTTRTAIFALAKNLLAQISNTSDM